MSNREGNDTFAQSNRMQIRCLLLDDSPIERKAITLLLKKVPEIELVAVCENPLEAFGVLSKENIDVVFSDINMPELTGIELLKSLKNPPSFIFITSFADYAVESFEVNALDYIVKPLTLPRLIKSVKKVADYLEIKANATPYADNKLGGEQQKNQFFVKDSKGYAKILYEDVVYIESMGDFIRIYTTEGKQFVVLVNLKNVEKQLPATMFMRIHKQIIINVKHIVLVANDNIELTNKYNVPLSNSYRQTLVDTVINGNVITRFT